MLFSKQHNPDNTGNHNMTYYDLLEAQAAAASEAAALFLGLVSDFSDMPAYLERLEAVEHHADDLTRALVGRLDAGEAAPLDRHDLRLLCERLDNITDSIESAALRIRAFRLAPPRADLPALASLLVGITQETQALVRQLRHGFRNGDMAVTMAGIHALEKQSDKTFWLAVSDLLDDATMDMRLLLKWKDVYERIEKAIDKCENVAALIENLRVKYT